MSAVQCGCFPHATEEERTEITAGGDTHSCCAGCLSRAAMTEWMGLRGSGREGLFAARW